MKTSTIYMRTILLTRLDVVDIQAEDSHGPGGGGGGWGFFFSSRRRHTRSLCDWSSDVCSSDLKVLELSTNEEFKKMDNDEKLKVIDKLKRKVKADIFEEYDFKKETVKKDKKREKIYSELIKIGRAS